jgi:hypothetical protein
LGGGDVEDPRGLGVYLECIGNSCGDMDEGAGGGRYRLAILQVKRAFSFKDVEGDTD